VERYWAVLDLQNQTMGVTLVAWRPKPDTTPPAGPIASAGQKHGK